MKRIDDLIIKKIVLLRQKGRSVPEISRECSVPRSTVLRYVRKVTILPKYYQRWLERRNASKLISERNWSKATQVAEKLIDRLNGKELVLIAAALYWAEGSKKDFNLLNTDSEMIRTFIYILQNIFHVKKEDLKISIRIYEDLNKSECLRHWSSVTGIHLTKKTSINIVKGSKKGKLKYGMCRVRVRKSGLLLKEFFSIIRRVQAYIPSL